MVRVKGLTKFTSGDLRRRIKEGGEWWGYLKQETLRVGQRLLEGTVEGEFL